MMEKFSSRIKFDKEGLIPAVIQDIRTKKVLMLAYMNMESLAKTLETRKTWFFSRSRNRLWNKGETSGNYQLVQDVFLDCDGDTLLIEVIPTGNSCHTGEQTCFYEKSIIDGKSTTEYLSVTDNLYSEIKNRKNYPREGSYTNYLFEKGLDKILKKIGEEASEIIIASKNNNAEDVVCEIADFIYHLLVLMVEKEITLNDIEIELMNRKKAR